MAHMSTFSTLGAVVLGGGLQGAPFHFGPLVDGGERLASSLLSS
jgi:hypothetical protein